MMLYLLGLVLVTAASVQARTFNNPILADQTYFYPSALKENGTYYIVAWTLEANGQFPIHTSTDLINWEASGYVFDANNAPKWALSSTLFEPEILKIGSNYIVYFDAQSRNSTIYQVGAAIASHPLGPYTALDEPILPVANESINEPTIINDEDKVYLVWRDYKYAIKARQLSSDGLSYSSNQTTTLLVQSLNWEGSYINSPLYIRRGSYHYLLYTGGGCTAGVARSSNALGPYEKLPNPILVPNNDFDCTSDVSVVKDLDDKGDVIFFSAYRNSDPANFYTVLVASLGWDAENWPIVEDF